MPGMLKEIFFVIVCLAGSMTDTVPPISEDTQSSELSFLYSAITRTRVDQHIRDNLARLGIDKMRHVGGLGCVDQDLSIRTKRHALWLDADLNVTHARAFGDVDDRNGVVILVGDVEDLARGILREQFGVWPGRQTVDHLLRRGVDHLDLVVISHGHQHELAILGRVRCRAGAGRP